MDRRCTDAVSGIARRTSSSDLEINIPSYVCGRRPAARRANRMRH
jgi:hypothetical protein